MSKLFPSVITTVGLLLSFAFLLEGPMWLVPAALFCDVLDGYVARKFKCESLLGAELDWAVDTGSCAAACLLIWPPLFVACPFIWSWCKSHKYHFSGRALAFIVLAWVRI